LISYVNALPKLEKRQAKISRAELSQTDQSEAEISKAESAGDQCCVALNDKCSKEPASEKLS